MINHIQNVFVYIECVYMYVCVCKYMCVYIYIAFTFILYMNI